MPYETIEALPPEVREEFSDECQEAFRDAFNTSQAAEAEDPAADGLAAARECAEPEEIEEAAAELDCDCDHTHPQPVLAGHRGTKVLPLEEAAVSESGEFSGYANVFGIVDDGGDKVIRGAFKSVLPTFLKEGFISWAHDWTVPVAMPRAATEDDHGLLIRAQFHGTPRAQEARQVTTERLAAGLSMGLSIGYEVGDTKDTAYGREIKSFKRLFETSLVMVPMNRPSTVTAIKDSLGSGRPFAERLTLALAQAEATERELKWLASHSRQRAALRHKEGRVLSGTNRERLKTLSGSLRDVLKDIDELLRATDPDSPKAAANAAVIAWVINEARLNGVPLD